MGHTLTVEYSKINTLDYLTRFGKTDSHLEPAMYYKYTIHPTKHKMTIWNS